MIVKVTDLLRFVDSNLTAVRKIVKKLSKWFGPLPPDQPALGVTARFAIRHPTQDASSAPLLLEGSFLPPDSVRQLEEMRVAASAGGRLHALERHVNAGLLQLAACRQVLLAAATTTAAEVTAAPAAVSAGSLEEEYRDGSRMDAAARQQQLQQDAMAAGAVVSASRHAAGGGGAIQQQLQPLSPQRLGDLLRTSSLSSLAPSLSRSLSSAVAAEQGYGGSSHVGADLSDGDEEEARSRKTARRDLSSLAGHASGHGEHVQCISLLLNLSQRDNNRDAWPLSQLFGHNTRPTPPSTSAPTTTITCCTELLHLLRELEPTTRAMAAARRAAQRSSRLVAVTSNVFEAQAGLLHAPPPPEEAALATTLGLCLNDLDVLLFMANYNLVRTVVR